MSWNKTAFKRFDPKSRFLRCNTILLDNILYDDVDISFDVIVRHTPIGVALGHLDTCYDGFKSFKLDFITASGC